MDTFTPTLQPVNYNYQAEFHVPYVHDERFVVTETHVEPFNTPDFESLIADDEYHNHDDFYGDNLNSHHQYSEPFHFERIKRPRGVNPSESDGKSSDWNVHDFKRWEKLQKTISKNSPRNSQRSKNINTESRKGKVNGPEQITFQTLLQTTPKPKEKFEKLNFERLIASSDTSPELSTMIIDPFHENPKTQIQRQNRKLSDSYSYVQYPEDQALEKSEESTAQMPKFDINFNEWLKDASGDEDNFKSQFLESELLSKRRKRGAISSFDKVFRSLVNLFQI